MHRAPEPPVEARISRWAPFVFGGIAVVVLLAIAAGVRFAEPGGNEVTTSVMPGTVTTSLPPATTGPAPDVSPPSTTSPASTTTDAPTDTPTTTVVVGSADQGPRYGGVATVGVVGEVRSLNPLGLDGNTAPVRALTQAVTTGAIRLDPGTLDPMPLAVETVPTIDNGGLEVVESGELLVRLVIRPEAVWSDGTPVSAADFVATYDIARLAAGVRSDVRSRYGAIVPGSLLGEGARVEYRLRQVGLDYLSLFDVLVPAHEVSIGGFASAWDDTMWAAGGAFRFFELDSDTSTIRLVANQRSWLTTQDGADPLPYLDGLILRFLPTRDEVIAGLQSGDLEVAAVGGDPAVLDALAADTALLLDVQRGPLWEQVGFQLGGGRTDVNPGSLTADVEVRRAIAALIDREALAAEVHGDFGRTLNSPVGLSWPAAASDAWSTLDDVDQEVAAAFLADIASAAEEPPVLAFSTTANDPAREAVARRLVAALEPLGFVVTVSRDEPGAYFLDRVIPGDFELAAWAWDTRLGPFGALTDLEDHHVVEWPDGTDFYRWGELGDPAYDQFEADLSAAQALVDPAALAPALTAIEEQLAEAVVFVPLYAELNGAAARADTLGGFRHSPLSGGELAYVAEWWSRSTP